MPLLKALLLTIIVELAVLIILKQYKIKLLISIIFTNIITNISMNVLIQYLPNETYDLNVFLLEIVVFLIEMLVYYIVKKDFKKAFIYSLVCNLSSYIIGLFLMPYIY